MLLPQERIRHLINSMRQLCQACVNAQGEATQYWLSINLFNQNNNFETIHLNPRCPLSPLLFILVVEIFALRNKQNKDIIGYCIMLNGNFNEKISHRGEDTTLFLNGIHEIPEVLREIGLFSDFIQREYKNYLSYNYICMKMHICFFCFYYSFFFFFFFLVPATGPLTQYLKTGCSESDQTWQSGRPPWGLATENFWW